MGPLSPLPASGPTSGPQNIIRLFIHSKLSNIFYWSTIPKRGEYVKQRPHRTRIPTGPKENLPIIGDQCPPRPKGGPRFVCPSSYPEWLRREERVSNTEPPLAEIVPWTRTTPRGVSRRVVRSLYLSGLTSETSLADPSNYDLLKWLAVARCFNGGGGLPRHEHRCFSLLFAHTFEHLLERPR